MTVFAKLRREQTVSRVFTNLPKLVILASEVLLRETKKFNNKILAQKGEHQTCMAEVPGSVHTVGNNLLLISLIL